ncbi:quinohemoprotein amine dehydrogenase subunit alpha [Xanthobacter sp. TB0136]|uniref:quinohemoprotein amine dehydrogenase subunit alpha n=1 Tax=Xanthobacter sp. TB0136 TaxID=3459177 RepID=UPI0040396FF1
MSLLSRFFLASTVSIATLGFSAPVSATDGAQVLKNSCASCHAEDANGKLERIDSVRKTPEAWDMTVVRMMRNNGLQLTDEERVEVVRHLANTRGLSVEETAPWRYILEKEPVAQDQGPSQLMTETCGRCHSYARVALQRRTPEDWKHLINFHLGQFPTIEYQAMARDRDWKGIAETQIADFLAKTYPLGETPAAAGDLSGEWVVSGRQPGVGDYDGTLTISKDGEDYDAVMVLDYPDGRRTFKGNARAFGAGEWRGALSDGKTEIRQVLGLKKDGTLEGRWFHADEDVVGGRMAAVRANESPRILSVSPSYLKAGETRQVTLTGIGLSGKPVLPKGITGKVVSATDKKVVLELTAGKVLGPVELGIGKLEAPQPLIVYDKLDRITVVPEVAMARIGGAGGPIPKVPAQFEAVGWMKAPDGKGEDILVGTFPASWTIDNFNEEAERMEDAKYAGSINDTGLFTPGDAGPNPARRMMANNIGNLKVIATVKEGGKDLQADAHLYATVQRFVDTPIR